MKRFRSGPAGRRPRRFERRTQRRSRRARAHLERRRRRGQVLGVGSSGRPLGAPGRRRGLRSAACGLLGLAAGFLAGPSALQAGFGCWKGHPSQIESISVSGHARLPARDVAEATGVARGSSVAEVDARAVEKRLALHPWIRSAVAAVLPSGGLLVEIEEREPRAVVRSGSQKQWQLVDVWGVPFAPAEPRHAATLPRLRSHPELAGNLEHEVLARTLAILDELPPGALRKLSPAVAEISEEAGGWPLGLELHLPAPGSHRGWVLRAAAPQVEVILGQEGIELRLERLAQLLDSELLREVRRAESIDLRFADRAVMRAASVSR